MSVEFTITDERSVTIPKSGCDVKDTETLGKLILDAGQEGYSLASVSEKREGDYRGDTYTVGYTLTFRRS